jgi:monoterpene epsilon-lactone hydrolase
MNDETSQPIRVPVSHGALSVPPRTVPVPTSISPEAQALLQAGVKGQTGLAFPVDGDISQWRSVIAAAEGALSPRLAPLDALPGIAASTESTGEATVYVAVPQGAPTDCAYLDMHGGALIMMGGEACRQMGRGQAMTTGITTYSIDYRMPPEHLYPRALDDCMAAYSLLLQRYSPEKIVVGGGSAGANLAAALILRARDEGLPLPAGLVLVTPEIDLTESGDSFATLLGIDSVLAQPLISVNRLYAGDADLSDPYLSPLFGDFSKGFPSTFLQAGTRDLFLSNAVRMHRRLRQAGIPVELHIFEAMPHGGFGGAPEDAELALEVRRFVRSQLELVD